MAGIKFGAHPMVVAVAMGLLGPGALLDEGNEDPLMPAMPGSSAHEIEDLDAPTADEFARVEDLWHSVRTKV